jgi:hypothetical protein
VLLSSPVLASSPVLSPLGSPPVLPALSEAALVAASVALAESPESVPQEPSPLVVTGPPESPPVQLSLAAAVPEAAVGEELLPPSSPRVASAELQAPERAASRARERGAMRGFEAR